MKITLYSTHCPICNVISTKLKQKNIIYNEVNDVDTIIAKGFMTVPILEVDGKIMNSAEAMKFIDNYIERDN